MINNDTKGQIIRVEDAEIDGKRHNISYRIREKSVKIATKFENGYPVLQANINLGMELMEINGQHQDLVVRSEFSNLSPEIISKIEHQLRNEFKEVVDILKNHSADILRVGDLFFNQHRNEYLTFIQNLDSEDEFIKDVVFQGVLTGEHGFTDTRIFDVNGTDLGIPVYSKKENSLWV